MRCPTCGHADKKKPEEVHTAGECAQCNCGSGDIVRRTPMAGNYCSRDEQGRMRSTDWGSYRVFEAPTLR